MPSVMKIAVLADIHYGSSSPPVERRSEIGDVLLRRAVRRLNRYLRPDVTLLLGDLLDDGEAPDAPGRRAALAAIVGEIESPAIVIPGNHDGDADRFYAEFTRPAPTLDVAGVRFVSFIDPEEPGWNARRTRRDLERLKEARRGHDGPLVCLQHVPLLPPGRSDCPFNLTNAGEVIETSRASGVTLTIAGHHHPGTPLVREGDVTFVVAPGLCEKPFPFCIIELEKGRVSLERHELALPAEPELFDFHTHTEFAYCSADMEMPRAVSLAREFGLAGMAFTEHSGQLLFDSETYWSGTFLEDGVDHSSGIRDRTDEYLARAGGFAEHRAACGFEVDCDFKGRPVFRSPDRDRVQLLLGAVHKLPELMRPRPDIAKAAAQFMSVAEKFLRSGIGVLAHPFRAFSRDGMDAPRDAFAPMVRLLKDAGVAAEVNFHDPNGPQVEFLRMCFEAGVKLAFGSDAHSLCDVGEFEPHLRLLEEIGAGPEALVRPEDLVRGWSW